MGLNKSILRKIEKQYGGYQLNKKTKKIKNDTLNKILDIFSEDSEKLYKYGSLTFHTLTLILLYYIIK